MKLPEKERKSTVKKMLNGIGGDKILTWLDDYNYYKAPAACKHHGAYEGGLFAHSLEVARQLTILTDKLNLQWERKESPAIVGLLHDVCKLDNYCWKFDEKLMDSDSNFVQNDEKIEWNNDKSMSGHGDKSVILLAGQIPLTEEEVMCIRFHMGAFTEKEEWGYYSKAVKKYPNVLYTHTADMIASQIIGV